MRGSVVCLRVSVVCLRGSVDCLRGFVVCLTFPLSSFCVCVCFAVCAFLLFSLASSLFLLVVVSFVLRWRLRAPNFHLKLCPRF